MAKDVLIIWDWSYLAEWLDEKLLPMNVERIHYVEDKDPNYFKNFGTVINFWIQPDFSKRILDVNELIDFQLANVLQWTDTELIKQDVTRTMNVWSWFAIPLKELLSHICWEENLVFAEDLPEPRDQFILDNKKLLQYVKGVYLWWVNKKVWRK